MNIRQLFGAAAAVAGVALLGAAPSHAAVMTGLHHASLNPIVASPAPSATLNWYDRWGNWHPNSDNDDRTYDRDDQSRFYHRRFDETRVYTVPEPLFTGRYYTGRWYHNHHWYTHRRIEGGIWIYF